jgi:SNF2 family DNA or RNA helicase
LETAIFAIRNPQRRVLLADEVGLGKTIEAGLIIKELALKGECERAVIITPASLVSQWETELRSKFSIDVHRIESQDFSMLKGDDAGIFLISIDLAKKRADLFKDMSWDLALFDEAHHLRQHLIGSGRSRATLKYKLGKIVSDRTRALIMLTATPMQLNYFEFYSLLELLDSDLFQDYETFIKYVELVLPDIRRTLKDLECPESDTLESARKLVNSLNSMFPRSLEPLILHDDSTDKEVADALSHFDYLSRIMIRHKKREEFPELKPRTVHTYPVQYTDKEMIVYGRISTFIREAYVQAKEEQNRGMAFLLVTFQQLLSSSPRALLNALRKRYGVLTHDARRMVVELDAPESDELVDDIDSDILAVNPVEGELEAVRDFIKDLSELKEDSKLKAFKTLVIDLLNAHPSEKVIVFTRFIETQRHIQEALSEELSVAVFNGKMSLNEKDNAVEMFRDKAQILISTEAGGEGRNLQFCHMIINYDLPWNPVRLEQRIGRIDRIGQKDHVIVTNLASHDTIEQHIMDSLTQRIAAFENIVGPVDPILGSIESDIEEIIMRRDELIEPVRTF